MTLPPEILASLLADLDAQAAAIERQRARLLALAAPTDAHTSLLPPRLIPVKAACGMVDRDASTLKRWCRDHGIGQLVGGRWYVHVDNLKIFIQDRKLHDLNS